jgi:hypothetical protein
LVSHKAKAAVVDDMECASGKGFDGRPFRTGNAFVSDDLVCPMCPFFCFVIFMVPWSAWRSDSLECRIALEMCWPFLWKPMCAAVKN